MAAEPSLIEALRRNAELAEKSLAFISDPDMAEEAREDADFWRRCAAELERTGKRLEKVESILREIRGGYDDLYSGGDKSRLLNAESLLRGLIPPLGRE